MEIIAHTHWDREWFVPLWISSQWLDELFSQVFRLCEAGPEFHFVLDGQTLIIDDYLSSLPPDRRAQAQCILERRGGQLTFGPFHGQIDWRMAEESAIRNVFLGWERSRCFGEPSRVAWCVDNFGFPSQTPQILAGLGIRSIVAWRGFDCADDPMIEFTWSAGDGSSIRGLYLLDSYRNVMRLGDAPEQAQKRLETVTVRLNPHSKSGHLPLLDGYDLDPLPEDPSTIVTVDVVSPDELMERISCDLLDEPPSIEGEQLSGRMACTFPGTLITRPYLKIEHWQAEYLLTRVVEPLACLTSTEVDTEREWDLIIQNLVHDSIGGVAVDRVHRDMELRYDRLFDSCHRHISTLIKRLAPHAPKGLSALNLNPTHATLYCPYRDKLLRIEARAGAFLPVEWEAFIPEERNEELLTFCFEAGCGSVRLEGGKLSICNPEGSVEVRPVLFRDNGDAYSIALADELSLKPVTMRLVRRTRKTARVVVTYTSEQVDLEMAWLFSDLPLVTIEATVTGKGSEYALLLALCGKGDILAGAPFDWVERPTTVTYDPVDGPAAAFLNAAREVGVCRTFPMKDFVALVHGKQADRGEREARCTALVAKGIYAYSTYQTAGGPALFLTRAVEWIARPGIEGRLGDAGPEMYVPEAATRRTFTHRLALYSGPQKDLIRWKNGFTNPPLIFHNDDAGGEGFELYTGTNVEMAAMKSSRRGPGVLLRLFAPTSTGGTLTTAEHCEKLDLAESRSDPFDGVLAPKEIATISMLPPAAIPRGPQARPVKLVYPELGWSCGDDVGEPDAGVLDELQRRAARLRSSAESIRDSGDAAALEVCTLLRQAVELELSVLLNGPLDNRERCKELQDLAREYTTLRVRKRSLELRLGAGDGL